MMIWIVLGCVVLALALLLLVPVRAKASYSQEGVRLALALGPITIPVVPRPPKTGQEKEKADQGTEKNTPAGEREKPESVKNPVGPRLMEEVPPLSSSHL